MAVESAIPLRKDLQKEQQASNSRNEGRCKSCTEHNAACSALRPWEARPYIHYYHMDMVSVIIGTRKGTKFYISIFNSPLATRESREVLKRKFNKKIKII